MSCFTPNCSEFKVPVKVSRPKLAKRVGGTRVPPRHGYHRSTRTNKSISIAQKACVLALLEEGVPIRTVPVNHLFQHNLSNPPSQVMYVCTTVATIQSQTPWTRTTTGMRIVTAQSGKKAELYKKILEDFRLQELRQTIGVMGWWTIIRIMITTGWGIAGWSHNFFHSH